ncbi:hypothetical protein NE852_03285 [Rhizobium sp. Pop5]|uniref:hypothetical protein n=1 Tax=Rhizobium sp. Pop5 TaxID=1223565 RepID=UPI000283C342|nr:hypothetical protein [Rhizobium sp. Pop5]EJZ22445.1 hypothetical protein RCCGEPOP_04756 [Rhizobium sp. Pop5]UVD57249.1 hypothetical protein NE852_03285 [Rhizobium sp. Pop5]
MSNELVRSESSSSPVADAGVSMPIAEDRFRTYSPARKAEIERIRDTDIDRYFAEGLDRELLAMMREDTGEAGPTDPMAVEVSRNQMMETPEGARFVMDMERLGGFKTQLHRLQGAVGGMVRDLGDARAQRVFMERFDRSFPEPLRYQIYSQLVMGPPSFVVPVTADKVKEFAVGDPGRELVREWGSDAPETIATIWKRVDNLKAAIGAAGMEVFKDWFNSLEIPHMKRVLQFIATGR